MKNVMRIASSEAYIYVFAYNFVLFQDRSNCRSAGKKFV